MTAYCWHTAARIKADANVAGQMFEKLEQTVGLTAETLLDANRPEDAPLHDEFEWDDSVAAEEYRKDQARHLIRCLQVKPSTEQVKPVRAYFRTDAAEYDSLNVIFSKPDKTAALFEQALKELRSFNAKYAALRQAEQFAGLFGEVDRLLEAAS